MSYLDLISLANFLSTEAELLFLKKVPVIFNPWFQVPLNVPSILSPDGKVRVPCIKKKKKKK